MIRPPSGQPWLGRFEGGYSSPNALTLVTNGPTLDQLVVVNRGAGFLLSATDPDIAVDLETTPIVGVVVDRAAGVLVVADFTNVTSVGSDGQRWRTEVSWDGVELDRIHDGVVSGVGWDASTGRHVPFAVELTSGELLKGPTPRP